MGWRVLIFFRHPHAPIPSKRFLTNEEVIPIPPPSQFLQVICNATRGPLTYIELHFIV